MAAIVSLSLGAMGCTQAAPLHWAVGLQNNSRLYLSVRLILCRTLGAAVHLGHDATCKPSFSLDEPPFPAIARA
jgi:hypothetical protein